MRLSEARWHTGATVLRDGEFESLGYLGHQAPKLCVYFNQARYLSTLLRNPDISGVITTEELANLLPPDHLGLVISPDPLRDFYELHNYLHRETCFYWTPFASEIAASARIHPAAYIAPTDVRIGERATIEPHATILPHSIIGNDVIIRAGAVIGAWGFEFKRFDGAIFPVDHAGGALLHDRVEVQTNACVDSAIFGRFTEIGEDSKIDTLVHVGHHVRIGRRTLVASSTVIAGSTTIGDDVWIGPGSAISSSISIGDGASVTFGSVVSKDVPPGKRVAGNFAIDYERFIAFLKTIR